MTTRQVTKVLDEIYFYWGMLNELHPVKVQVIEDMVDEINRTEDISKLPDVLDKLISISEEIEQYEWCADILKVKEGITNGKSRDIKETGDSNFEGERIHRN